MTWVHIMYTDVISTCEHVYMCTYLVNMFVDIDECTYQNGGCSQKCNNTNGAYRCICSKGYVLGADLRSCEGLYVQLFNVISKINSHD